MNFLVFNLLLLLSGFLALFVFSFGMMIVLAPQALLLKLWNPLKILIYPLIVVSGIYQIFFWGLWAAICVALTLKFIHKPDVTWNWLYWSAAFMWSVGLIGWLAFKERQTRSTVDEVRDVEKGATMYSLIAIIAFLVFAFFPSFTLPIYGWALKPLRLEKHISTKIAGNIEKAEPQPVTTQTSHTDKELCKTAIISFLNAHAMMSDDQGRIVQLSTGEESQMKSLIRTGLAAASNVSDEYLRKIHPELPREFREHLVEGWLLYVNGLENSDPQKQIQGIQLIQLWLTFKEKNVDLLYESIIK